MNLIDPNVWREVSRRPLTAEEAAKFNGSICYATDGTKGQRLTVRTDKAVITYEERQQT